MSTDESSPQHGFDLAGGPSRIASVLRVIWFQDDFVFLVDHVIRTEIAAIDWERTPPIWQP